MAPFESFTNYVFGKVANEARDYSLAVEFLGNAIKMADEYDKLNFCHQWYLERAISYSILDLDSQAENDYKACLNLNLNNQDCYAEYGIFLANRGRKDEACKNFRILYNKNPNYLRGQKESIKELMFPYCN